MEGVGPGRCGHRGHLRTNLWCFLDGDTHRGRVPHKHQIQIKSLLQTKCYTSRHRSGSVPPGGVQKVKCDEYEVFHEQWPGTPSNLVPRPIVFWGMKSHLKILEM